MTRRRDEAGLSLIEVLVSVTLTSILAGVMLQAMFTGMRTIDDANDRVAGSNDTQLVATYFTSDVASARTVSATGTKSHAAPGVSPTVTNTKLVSFWGLKRPTGLTKPVGMTEGWNVASPQFRIAMADETSSAAGATGNRVATSIDGTSSITHSVALAPPLLGPAPVRRAGVPPSATTGAGGATTLSVAKPALTAQNDTLVAQVAVSGGTTTFVSPPSGWTLVNKVDSGIDLQSLVFQKLALSGEPSTYAWSFKDKEGVGGSPVTREAAIGIAAYSGVVTTGGVNSATTELNPCGGDTPVLLLGWTDRHANTADDVAIEVSYNAVAVGDETHLVRRRCEAPSDQDLSGKPSSQNTLASSLAPATAFASCVSSSMQIPTTSTTAASGIDYCAYLPVTVTMSLTEPPGLHETSGRTYVMRASTRTDVDEG